MEENFEGKYWFYLNCRLDEDSNFYEDIEDEADKFELEREFE